MFELGRALIVLFQHTAARRQLDTQITAFGICFAGFNTQPPEGSWLLQQLFGLPEADVSTHSRPKAAGSYHRSPRQHQQFQHTAARRQLDWTRRHGSTF